MPKAPEPSSTCQKTTKSLPRISPKSYCYNAVPNRFLAHFQLLAQTAHVCFHEQKRVHTHLRQQDRTQRLTRRNRGDSDGEVSLPSERSTRFGNPAWPGGRTANFAAFGALSGVLPKNAESLRNSDALMRVAVPRRRGPAGLRDLFVSDEITVFTLCAQGFPRVRDMGGITTLGVLCVLLKCRTAACKSG